MSFRNFFRILVAAGIFAAAAEASATPTLLVDSNGILTGAKNVIVAGTLYDVTFADGSCNSIFNRCSPSAFAFPTLAKAMQAARVLLDEVFVNGPAGQFDSEPFKVFGCSASTECVTFIPAEVVQYRSLYVNGGQAINSTVGSVWSNDTATVGTTAANMPLSTFLNWNYAVFDLAPPPASDVPEPSSIALMGVALIGLALARRRNVSKRVLVGKVIHGVPPSSRTLPLAHRRRAVEIVRLDLGIPGEHFPVAVPETKTTS